MVQELQRRWQYHLSEGITDALECRVKVQMSVKGIKIVILIAKTQCVSSPCCGYKPHVFAWCVRTLGFWWGIAHYSCIFIMNFWFYSYYCIQHCIWTYDQGQLAVALQRLGSFWGLSGGQATLGVWSKPSSGGKQSPQWIQRFRFSF